MKPIIVTFLLTYGGSVTSLIRPYAGLLIYVAFAIIKPESIWGWAIPLGMRYSFTIALALLLGWALHGFGSWRFGRGRLIILALVGFWLIIVFNAAFLCPASHAHVAWQRVENLSKGFLPILVGMSLIDSMARLKQLVWVIVLTQGYLAYEFNLTFYEGGIDPSSWTHGGLDNNGIAITMVTTVGMAFFLGLHAERPWHRVLAMGLALLMAHVVLFSSSRGGMMALIVTGITIFLLIPKQPKHYLFFLVAFLLVLRLAGPSVRERFMTSFMAKQEGVKGADEGGGRLDQWAACWRCMLDNPLGVGVECWPITGPRYGVPGRPAHSTWFQMGAEQGILGLSCLLAFYLITMWRLWPLARRPPPTIDPWFCYLARMVIACIVGFMASAQFVTVEGVELPYYVVVVGAGALKILSVPGTQSPLVPARSYASHQRRGVRVAPLPSAL